MAFTGYLSKFSLPELFQFLEEGYKTGLLTVRTLAAYSTQVSQVHYIWLNQGRIVAAANRLDKNGLILMISQRGWVHDSLAFKLFSKNPTNIMGLFLKSQGLLESEQLTLLFRTQVTGQICPLFQLQEGQFEFDFQAPLPNAEMTGLSMQATEATLMGLRMLQDWTALADKLPELTSGLAKKIKGQPKVRLESIEWQICEYANGCISLNKIAQQLGLTSEKVQQIAFRLIVSNLVEELFMIDTPFSTIPEENKIFSDLDSTNAFGAIAIPTFSSTTHEAPNEVLDETWNTTLKEIFNEVSTVEKIKIKEENNKALHPDLTPPIADKKPESNRDYSSKNLVSQSFLQNLVGFLQNKVTT
jgi:Domain of unknown function (DUF4388)